MRHSYFHVMDAALKCAGSNDYSLPHLGTKGARRHGGMGFSEQCE